jgi:regulator of RNase E activity RraA
MTIDCIVHPRAADLPDYARRFAALPTAAISDSQDRVGGAPGISPIPSSSPRPLFGPAFTVRTRHGDNLVVHKALDLAKPGDVLVVDAGGHVDRAILGGLMVRYALTRGIAGLVVDGAVRDAADIEALGLPVYARAVTHVGPYKDGPGEVGGPVSMCGTVVRSGDVVVGDRDGIVFVSRDRLNAVLALAEALVANERRIIDAIGCGAWDRSWVDQKLHVVALAPYLIPEPEEDAARR